MADLQWLSTEIKGKEQRTLDKAAAECRKGGHVWKELDTAVAPGGGTVSYCTRCLKSRIGTTVEWLVHGK